MATRFPLLYTPSATGVTPASLMLGWDSASPKSLIGLNSYPPTAPVGASLTLLNNNVGGSVYSSKYVCLRRYVSKPMPAGQSIPGYQSIWSQVLCGYYSGLAGVFYQSAVAVGVISKTGVLSRYIGSAIGTTYMPLTTNTGIGLVNNSCGGTGSAGNYVTQAGDRILIEFGYFSYNTTTGYAHNLFMNLGFNSANFATYNWLPSDTVATDLNQSPWVQISATLSFSDYVEVDPGAFTLTGQTTDYTRTRLITPDTGAYSLAGQDTNLNADRPIVADVGAYVLAGQDTTYIKDNILTPETGVYNVFGQDVSFIYGQQGAVDVGEFTLAGQDVDLLAASVLVVDSGVYGLAGQTVDLMYDGELIISGTFEAGNGLFWLLIDEKQ